MKSQADRLLDLLKDGKEHSTVEIMERVYGGSHLGLARVGARVFDLRKKGWLIEGKKDPKNPAIYIYQLKNPPKQMRVDYEMRDGVRYAKISYV